MGDTNFSIKNNKNVIDGNLINIEKALAVEIRNSDFDSSLANGHFISISSIQQLKISKLLFHNINSIINNNEQSASVVCIRIFNIFQKTIVYLSIINVYSTDNTAGIQIIDNDLTIQKMKYLQIDDIVTFEVNQNLYT